MNEKHDSAIRPSEATHIAWTAVERSRHPQRPHTLDYVQKIFSDYEELRGDRSYADDAALVAGVGTLKSVDGGAEQSVFFLGNQKGRSTKQKIERNFGMANPEGYRKAIRIMEMADRFRKPIVTFIDTPGAFPGIAAEERGQAEAIASSILRMSELKVPSVAIVIGEGGSGGALAIGVADRLLMLRNSTYSVISPESCAAILWANAGEAKQAAVALKITAKHVRSLGICDEVIEEPEAGAHADVEGVAAHLNGRIQHHLRELGGFTPEKRAQLKFEKYRLIDEKLRG